MKTFKRALDSLWFSILRRFLSLNPQSKNLLLVRTDGIGDLVFFLPVLNALKELSPGNTLVLVCRPESAELARSLDLVDTVIAFGYKSYRWNYLYRLFVLWRIRSTRPALAINASFHRQHIGDEMTLLSGAPKTVAFLGNDEIIHPAVRRRNNGLYDTVVVTEDHIPEHRKYGHLLQVLGIEWTYQSPTLAEMNRSPVVDDPYVVVGAGGSSPFRRWSAEKIADLCSAILREHKARVILCGSRAEEAYLRRIASRAGGNTELSVGQPLERVVELIKKAKLFVGNESGLLHIAASVGTPAVAILGGGHFSRYFPYGNMRIVSYKLPCYECNWKCPFPEPYCLSWISEEDVMSEVRQVMAND